MPATVTYTNFECLIIFLISRRCSSKSASIAKMAILCSWIASNLGSSSRNISNLLSAAASLWLNVDRKVTMSVAIVGREYSASLRRGDLNPTDSGESKGANFDATRDNACRIESNSGREHYISATH
jgi:hypothetical protein